MEQPRRTELTADEFIAWALEQPGRFELAEGQVVAMVPERVSHDQKCSQLIGNLAQLLQPADARRVAFEPDCQDVPHVRRDFHPVRDEDFRVLLAERPQVPRLPHAVVFRDVHARQADPVRLFDEVVGVEHGIGSALEGVQVHVDDRARHNVLPRAQEPCSEYSIGPLRFTAPPP